MGAHTLRDGLTERARPSTYAWAAVMGGVALYDYFAPAGEQLSERADEWVEHPVKRIVFGATVAAFALHLTNEIKPEWDVIHRVACFKPKSLR